MARFWTYVRGLLTQPLLVVGLLYALALGWLLWRQHQEQVNLVEATVGREAARYADALAELRTMYTSEVVEAVRSHGIEVTHDYKEKVKAIPLPATFSMELGNRITARGSGGKTLLYSAYPFAWREATGGLRDAFARDAWDALRSAPAAPFFRVEETDGGRVFRYALADLMRTRCVDCHNSHKDSPKKDWKEGDVRGVLEVTIPLDAAVATTQANLRTSLWLLAGALAPWLVMMAFVAVRLQRAVPVREPCATDTAPGPDAPTAPVSARRASRLLAPAVVLMNRLTYPRKFFLISVLFVLPLGLVMYLLVSEINSSINFADKEIRGARYLRPLRTLTEHVIESRLLARTVTAGQITQRPDLIRKQAEIEDDFRAIAAVQSELGGLLKSTARLEVVQEDWRFLKAKLLALEPTDSETLHTHLLADIRALYLHVGDTSNLILDPDLDSYYVMDALLLKLPEGQDLLAQAALLSQKTLGANRPLTAAEKTEFIRLESLVRSNMTATKEGLTVAFRNNPAENLRPQLDKLLYDYLAALENFLDMLTRDVVPANTPRVSADDYAAAVKACLRNNGLLWDRSVAEMDGLLRARIAGFAQKRSLVQVFSVVVLAIVVYLLVAFYAAVMRIVAGLRDASDRMMTGSVDQVVTLETQD